MATCTQYFLAGLGQECKGAASGVKRIFIGLDREWDVNEASGQTAAPHSVTITKDSDITGDTVFYEYFVMDEAASLTSTLNVNNQSGVRYYSNVLSATFVRMRPEKHIEMMALANEKLIVIVEDNNGYFWVLQNASATAETAQSGQATDDLSGYQIEVTSRSGELPFQIEESNLPAIDELRIYN